MTPQATQATPDSPPHGTIHRSSLGAGMSKNEANRQPSHAAMSPVAPTCTATMGASRTAAHCTAAAASASVAGRLHTRVRAPCRRIAPARRATALTVKASVPSHQHQSASLTATEAAGSVPRSLPDGGGLRAVSLTMSCRMRTSPVSRPVFRRGAAMPLRAPSSLKVGTDAVRDGKRHGGRGHVAAVAAGP